MKNKTNVLKLLLALGCGTLLVSCEMLFREKSSAKAPKQEEIKAGLEVKRKWEASPDGVRFKQWQQSPEGKKIYASHEKVKNQIREFSDMEAIVSSVTFQRPGGNSISPEWLIVRINGEEYMMQFTPEEFTRLKSIRVNDKIIIRSRSAGFSPNHPYLILSADYIAKNYHVLFLRNQKKKNAC